MQHLIIIDLIWDTFFQPLGDPFFTRWKDLKAFSISYSFHVNHLLPETSKESRLQI